MTLESRRNRRSLPLLPPPFFYSGFEEGERDRDSKTVQERHWTPTMPLFGKSHKSPTDIVKALKDNLSILVKQDKKTEKVTSYFIILKAKKSISSYYINVHACYFW